MSEFWSDRLDEMIPASPYDFFEACFRLAREAALPQFESMVLITATKDAKPSGRVVLLRGVVRDRGFRFFTNFESRKAIEMIENPEVQLLFYWPHLGRQIRIEGKVACLPEADSDAYWATRPRTHQLGALVSLQSRTLSSADEMAIKMDSLGRAWEGKDIPRPANWGGFEVRPRYFEFWSDRESRLHERITYSDVSGNWAIGRLWP